MRANVIALYIEQYTIVLLLCFIHELSHWIVAFFTFCLGMNTFPVIVIKRWFHCEVNEDDSISSSSHHLAVNFRYDKDFEFIVPVICLAPALTTVLLFIYSPFWILPLYVCNLSTLWISTSDMRMTIDYFRGREIKSFD